MTPSMKQILWVDDEIDQLRSHVIYLGERGYEVTSVTNGPDALELMKKQPFDLALIDEMMPGMDGLETLQGIKRIRPDIPAVMVTKSEEEDLMDQAIGSQIDGYLIKPVNPSQILSTVKRLIDKRQISATQLSQRWAAEFADLSRMVESELDADGWLDLHNRLCVWEIEMDRYGEAGLDEMLQELRSDADARFAHWVEDNYQNWIASYSGERPALSMDVVDKWLVPLLDQGKPTLFLVVDCLRLDQWLMLEPLLSQFFDVTRDGYHSILPTATPYARNALFSGLTPAEIERLHPDLWSRGDEDEASSNRFERQFLNELLIRRNIEIKPEPRYVKILESEEANEFERRVQEYVRLPLTMMVYNFFDILVHTRQSVEVLQEMLPDESALRSVTKAWFQHSSLFRILQAYGAAGANVLLTTDHGSLRVKRGTKVIGDRETSTSLRFKYGRNLRCDSKRSSIRIKNPVEWGLPRRGVNTEYIIAPLDYLFLYPNNYNRYLDLYRDSFQHGGVSLNEMALPVVTLKGKG